MGTVTTMEYLTFSRPDPPEESGGAVRPQRAVTLAAGVACVRRERREPGWAKGIEKDRAALVLDPGELGAHSLENGQEGYSEHLQGQQGRTSTPKGPPAQAGADWQQDGPSVLRQNSRLQPAGTSREGTQWLSYAGCGITHNLSLSSP